MIKLTLISTTFVLLAITPAIARPIYMGTTSDGAKLYYHSVPVPELIISHEDAGAVIFFYTIEDKKSTRKIEAFTWSCDSKAFPNPKAYEMPEGWYVRINGRQVYINANSEASQKMLRKACYDAHQLASETYDR